MSVFVIAEAGVNHDGRVGQALLLANAAKEAGADAVKFQHFNSARLWGDDRIAHLELSDAEMVNVKWHCDAIGIEFLCTPFGVPEVEFLAPLLKRVKVASGCLERWDLLAAVRVTGLPVILSTGMADMDRVAGAVAMFPRLLSEKVPRVVIQNISKLTSTQDVSVALSRHEETMQLRGNAAAWATKLPGMPCSVYEALEKVDPADRSAKEEGQLQELRGRVLEAREDPEAAMRSVWGPELADAPPELRRAIERGLALSVLSLGSAPRVDPQTNLTLLHCTSSYPCPTEEVNLAAMDALRARWPHLAGVGYSDHTAGIVIALAAVARGAAVLEKHLTLDRQAEGPDHKASIEPKEFRIMVDAIRTVEAALGTTEKRPQPSEAATAKEWYP